MLAVDSGNSYVCYPPCRGKALDGHGIDDVKIVSADIVTGVSGGGKGVGQDEKESGIGRGGVGVFIPGPGLGESD